MAAALDPIAEVKLEKLRHLVEQAWETQCSLAIADFYAKRKPVEFRKALANAEKARTEAMNIVEELVKIP